MDLTLTGTLFTELLRLLCFKEKYLATPRKISGNCEEVGVFRQWSMTVCGSD